MGFSGLMRPIRSVVAAAWLVSLGGGAAAAGEVPPDYAYPIQNPYAATVIGLPGPAPVEEELAIGERRLTVFPDRGIPRGFWYTRDLRYSVALQDHPAPLVFQIAGTGSTHLSTRHQGLQRVLYERGFHAVTLPSPTSQNFLVNASELGMSGDMRNDAVDLLRVMKLIRDDLEDEIKVTGWSLTGYSLGGANAIYVGRLDAREEAFGFDRIVAINPPVSLWTSLNRLDDLLEENLPPETPTPEAFFLDLVDQISANYVEGASVELNEDALYQAFAALERPEQQLPALIGTVFRFYGSSMLFTSDVMTNAGFIVPVGREIRTTTSTEEAFVLANRISFVEYTRNLFIPYLQRTGADVDLEEMIWRNDMRSIEPYLRDNPQIAVIHNRDDFILDPADLAWLEETLGERVTIFPNGGHIGNMLDPVVLRVIADRIEG